MKTANGWVSHTHNVIEETQNIVLILTEAEDYNNQYKLSGDIQSIKNYRKVASMALPALSHLRSTVSDNPVQVRNVDSMTKYVQVKLEQMSIDNNSVLIAVSAKPSHILQNDLMMDHCRKIANLIINNENKLLAQREKNRNRKIYITNLIVFSSIVIVVLLLLALFFFIRKTFFANQRLKEELQLSESIFSGAFNGSGIGMAIVSLKGRWIDINPYLLQLLGYTKDELLQKTFQDITHPDDLEADLSLLEQVLAGAIDTYKLEKRYFHKEGHIIWTMLTVSIVRWRNGDPRFFVSQVEDISATKELIQEQELKNMVLSQTSQELENKVKQLEDFNGIVAHNLRGPAGGIEKMLEMVMEENDEAEKAKMIDLVYNSSKSMNATLKDLMGILEIRLNQGIEYSNCDLTEIIRTTTDMLQGEILRSKAKIITDFSVPVVRFPKVYLESVFYNMVSNSLKYKKSEEPVIIHISSALENGKVMLTFKDNGLGIDLEQYGKQMFKLNKVFHRGYDSRGVGLFITKNQLEAHGGTITVNSKPGEGTEFKIYLKAKQ
ncbi:MAG: PAS domain S-box protein [Bacteroidetes bacterium]|nr:PAS domain S-box protein [Bacteroidota bacterium]